MNLSSEGRLLAWVALLHLVVGLVCLVAHAVPAAPLLGVHPAAKPMKFGLSIAIFLASMAVVVPALSLDGVSKAVIAWLLAVTMVLEMVGIVTQALRGTTSHFNLAGAFNAAIWRMMVLAIVVTTLTMIVVAGVATMRPLLGADGAPWAPLMRAAWCAGLWLFLVAAVSGFGMGGRLQHSVGGADGGSGLPLLNWSTKFGDLRVPHFLGLHSLQTLPLCAGLLGALRSPALSTALFAVVLALHVGLAGLTLQQAFAGRSSF